MYVAVIRTILLSTVLLEYKVIQKNSCTLSIIASGIPVGMKGLFNFEKFGQKTREKKRYFRVSSKRPKMDIFYLSGCEKFFSRNILM
jgi:hypothetical protein